MKNQKSINEKSIVMKRNVLNEMRKSEMTLQELRFFTIYLSKIDKNDPETQEQSFSLTEFKNIMEMENININQLKETTRRLLQRVITINDDQQGYEQFQLFKRCKCEKTEDGWILKFCASEDAYPLMFDFKQNYFKYELWNALCLKSRNQLRMYELLKQYEKLGKRRIKLEELRDLIGIKKEEYEIFNVFKIKVLDACKKALEENTDIRYEYKLIKRGKGGKVREIEFEIYKNENFVDRFGIKKYITPNQEEPCIDIAEFEEIAEKADEEEDIPEIIGFLNDACNGEFTREQLEYIFDLIVHVPESLMHELWFPLDNINIARFHYVKAKYDYMNTFPNIKNRFKYLCKMIEVDIE